MRTQPQPGEPLLQVRVRDHSEAVRAGLRSRGLDPDVALQGVAALDAERRRLIPEVEGLKRDQNAAGEQIAQARRDIIESR